jgi:hypothetical protein
MAITEVRKTGFLGNMMNSIIAVPIGILLFLASFAVLFMNEGRTNWAKIAETSVVADAASASGFDGQFVSVTGALTSTETVGDPEFVAPGPYLALDREVEVYAWVEKTTTETRDKVGGGTETTTTYSYELEWTSSVPSSANFREAGHDNPPQRHQSASYRVAQATVGAWPFAIADAVGGTGGVFDGGGHGIPGASAIAASQLQRIGIAATGAIDGNYIYLNGATPGSPRLGDHRLSFRALAQGGTATAFAQAQGGRLVPAPADGDNTMLRVLNGDRNTAIAALLTEYKMKGWLFRVLGFLMMWFGMQMVFAPLHALAGILPFIKKGTKFIIGLITFFLAGLLTSITVLVSMVLHSWIAIAVTLLLFGGIVGFLWSRRSKDGAAPAAPAGYAPPPGPPPGGYGPPPGPPPGGYGPPPGPPPA